jgi:hypothetical protein
MSSLRQSLVRAFGGEKFGQALEKLHLAYYNLDGMNVAKAERLINEAELMILNRIGVGTEDRSIRSISPDEIKGKVDKLDLKEREKYGYLQLLVNALKSWAAGLRGETYKFRNYFQYAENKAALNEAVSSSVSETRNAAKKILENTIKMLEKATKSTKESENFQINMLARRNMLSKGKEVPEDLQKKINDYILSKRLPGFKEIIAKRDKSAQLEFKELIWKVYEINLNDIKPNEIKMVEDFMKRRSVAKETLKYDPKYLDLAGNKYAQEKLIESYLGRELAKRNAAMASAAASASSTSTGRLPGAGTGLSPSRRKTRKSSRRNNRKTRRSN